MKQNNLGKITWLILLLLLLAALTVMPAAAQGPDGEEDVSVQVGFTAIQWNPPAGINVPVGGASAINRVNITGAFEASAFVLEIGYDAAVVQPDLANIQPGNLLSGTPGVDFFWDKDFMAVAPVCAAGAAIPAGIRITVAYLNSGVPIEGSGPLVEIPWQHAGGAGPSFLCVDPANSQLVDQQGIAAAFPLTITPVNVVAPVNQFRIGLQGGKFSNLSPAPGSAPFQIPATNVVDVTVNGPPCIVLPAAPPADGSCAPGSPPPYNVTVERPGYLDVQVTFATNADVRSVYMLPGDLNNDNVINILDLVNMANLLGNTFVYDGLQSPILEQADFTGPGFSPDGVINISDLVLVARNFGRSGPTDGTGAEF